MRQIVLFAEVGYVQACSIALFGGCGQRNGRINESCSQAGSGTGLLSLNIAF